MQHNLSNHRYHAAIVSGGTSNTELYSRVLTTIRKKLLSGRVLDFGAGTGNLTKLLKTSGQFNGVYGIDLFERPIDLDAEIIWIQGDLNEVSSLPTGEFDLITAIEVIEHLENPRAVMREWYRLLRPSGIVIMTTPNSENLRSYFSLAFKRHFWAFTSTSYPAHITALLEADIRRICSEVGFGPPQFDFQGRGGIPKLPHISWQEASFGCLKGRLFCDNVMAIFAKLE